MDNIITMDRIDFAVLLGDALADNGLIDSLAGVFCRFFSDASDACGTWFGSEICTPSSSAPPRVIWPDQGQWNGIIIVEAGQAAFWIGFRNEPRPMDSRAWNTGDVHGSPWPRGQQQYPFDEPFFDPYGENWMPPRERRR